MGAVNTKNTPERKRRKKSSIRRRGMLMITLLILTAALLVVGVFTALVYTRTYGEMSAALTLRVENEANLFRRYVSRTREDYLRSADALALNFEDRNVLELQFLSPEGLVEISSTGIAGGTVRTDADVAAALADGSTQCRRGRATLTGERIMAAAAPLHFSDGSVAGVVRVVTSLRVVEDELTQSCLTALEVALGVWALVLIANWFFLGTITRPISSLNSVAQRIAGGSYGAKVEKQFNDEIGELTDTINNMSQKLAQTEKLQTEFISSVSHELRTPLTAITGWTETMAFDESMSEDSRKGLEIITRETSRLTKMVEDLLEFTRIQDGRFTLRMGEINLPELVEETLCTYSELFKQAGMTVSYDPPEEDYPNIPGDGERLKQVVLNLLDNACKYGRSGKKIDIALKRTEVSQGVSIRDYGPGVPPDELPKIKNRFYKGSSKERGNGIGLAVCEEIVSRHNGKLMIYNAEGGGLLVTVTLPAE